MSPLSGRLGHVAVGVLTIVDEERVAVCDALGDLSRSGKYWRGAEHRVVVRQSPDRSNVPAYGATRTLIEDWRPELVLLVGIAGAIAGRGPWLGDVVVPDYLHYADFRKLLEGSDDARYCAYDQPTVSLREEYSDPVRLDDAWNQSLSERPHEDGAPRDFPKVFADGPLVAGEKVLGNPKHYEQRRVVSHYPDALAIDMESFGVARAVHEARRDPDYNPRLLVIRGVSDLVFAADDGDAGMQEASPDHDDPTEKNNEQRKRWKSYAARSAAAFASAVIAEYTR